MSKEEEAAYLRELILRAQAKDEDSLTELYFRLAPSAFKAGRRAIKDPDLLQDLVDRTFMRFINEYRVDGGSNPIGYFYVKWTSVFADHFKSPYSGSTGATEPPRDEHGKLVPIPRVDVADQPDVGPRDRFDADVKRSEWLLDWAPLREKVLARLAESGGDAKQIRGWTRALDVVAIRALGWSFTDTELARELACDPKQAARYIEHIHKLVRLYWSSEEGQP